MKSQWQKKDRKERFKLKDKKTQRRQLKPKRRLVQLRKRGKNMFLVKS